MMAKLARRTIFAESRQARKSKSRKHETLCGPHDIFSALTKAKMQQVAARTASKRHQSVLTNTRRARNVAVTGLKWTPRADR